MGCSLLNKCSSGDYSSNSDNYTPSLPPNPNPSRFKIIKVHKIHSYSILLVEYEDCINYEGKKILLFDKQLPKQLNILDPHFSEKGISPIARFKPDEDGWNNAILFVELLVNINKIPKGIYCYDNKGICPYWSRKNDKPEQENGFCSFLNKGDWELTVGLLWDQCKECGINNEGEADER